MSRVSEQKQRIQDVESARYITGALRDISAIELRKLRKKFETNDMFYAELRELFQLVWKIASINNTSSTSLQEEEGELFIAYTTNKHFYGTLNHDVMKRFVDNTNRDSECLIIGDTGKQIWTSQSRHSKSTDYLSFKEDDPTSDEVDTLMARVKKYQHVYVFYPGFKSVFKQEVQMVDITYKPSKHVMKKGDIEDSLEYIFEPDLSEMITFFNSQVRFTLLERLLLETQISRVAARLVKMDTADQNASKLIKVEMRKLSRVRTSFSSRRMLETVVGFIQWHNRQKQLIGQ